jgi:hypothetical protein
MNKRTRYLFLGATKLTERRHLDELVLLIVQLLLDHLFFSCGGLYIASEITKDHNSISCGE